MGRTSPILKATKMTDHYLKNVWFCVSVIVLANFGIISAANNETVQSEDAINWLRNGQFGYDFFSHLNSTPTAIRAESNSQSKCLLHFRFLLNGIIKNDKWALKFVDAWGKLPSGILYGHFMELGNFDECLSIAEALDSDNYVEGKYCLSKIPMGANAAGGQNGRILNLKIGICMPAACNSNEIDAILKEFLKTSLNLKLNESIKLVDAKSCTVRDRGSFDSLDWIAIVVLCCLGFLMFLSTFYDYFKTKLGKTLNPLLVAFSVRSNMRQLFHTTSHKNSPHVIHCLHGIRCLSIIWIVFGHCFMLMVGSPHINTIDIIKWVQSPSYMLLQNATFSVDSFFFLSGLLLALIALRSLEKTEGKINVPMMYLHRYIRLTPVLALAMLIFVSLYRYIGNGPLWNVFTNSYTVCEESWWATLLYVQNYVHPDKQCFGHAWYLAVDTQLYVISPLVLLLIWKWKRKGLAVLSVIGLLLVACLLSIMIINKIVFFNIRGNMQNQSDVMRKIYFSTHTRTSPWIIGIIMGYFLHHNSEKRFKLSKITVLFGWIFSLALIFTVIFSLYPTTQPGAPPMTAVESALHLTLSRVAWPLALCWVVFACVSGYGGPINQFLSWSFWQPLSKLTYCLYITHLLVESINAGRIKTNTHFSNYDAILRFWGDFGISICVSLVMYLAIEAPMVGIEKFFFSTKKPTQQAAAVTQSQQKLCD